MKLKVFYKGYFRQNKGYFSEILTKIKSKSMLNFRVILIGSIYLSIFTGSLIYEHYTRECEFGNFDKIKNKKKKHKKKQHKKNTKTFG